ncbi:hypothetical protein ACMT4L_03005 [Deinococcus sp. A31D244]|uniref:hypothetical protein n=1 Tax=Deinococcus sp. A31D244 TaxID=3397675 RepID=UPI0039E03018
MKIDVTAQEQIYRHPSPDRLRFMTAQEVSKASRNVAAQEALMRSISLADTEGLVTKLAVNWTVGVQAAGTGE